MQERAWDEARFTPGLAMTQSHILEPLQNFSDQTALLHLPPP